MSKREVIELHKGDKRYARWDEPGQFTESQVNVGHSLAADRRSKSKTVVPKARATAAIRRKADERTAKEYSSFWQFP
jgi:predicted cupin superfamily sugar epimerase